MFLTRILQVTFLVHIGVHLGHNLATFVEGDMYVKMQGFLR